MERTIIHPSWLLQHYGWCSNPEQRCNLQWVTNQLALTSGVTDGMATGCVHKLHQLGWTTSTTGYPPVSGNTGGPTGTTVGGIGGATSSAFPWVAFTSGTVSAPIEIALDPGYELRFTMVRGGSWSGEVVLQIQETVLPDNSWEGPTISGNTITFDSVDNNPTAVGLALFNCDVNDYSINTESNTITIGQNAVLNEGCIWNDVGSSLQLVLTNLALLDTMMLLSHLALTSPLMALKSPDSRLVSPRLVADY